MAFVESRDACDDSLALERKRAVSVDEGLHLKNKIKNYKRFSPPAKSRASAAAVSEQSVERLQPGSGEKSSG